MAKKTGKKPAAKKTSKKTSKKKPKPGPATPESILADCEKAVKKGLGRKQLGPEAREYWTRVYTASITAKLEKDGDTWKTDKKTVLHVAKKMGKVAAVLTEGSVVQLWAAEAAGHAAKRDPYCQAGRGGYCETA